MTTTTKWYLCQLCIQVVVRGRPAYSSIQTKENACAVTYGRVLMRRV